MSTENRRSETTRTEPVFTIYPGYQGTVEHGFYHDPSQAPPPKYEDVISGEYLKQNYTECQDTTPPAHNQEGVWMYSESTPRPSPPSPQTEPLEVHKKKKATGVMLFISFLIVILILRVYCFI